MGVLVSLASDGKFQIEFPGGRKIVISPGKLEGILGDVLFAQEVGKVSIGEDGSPTAQQVKHWEKHEIFPDSRCVFCQSRRQASSRPRLTKFYSEEVERELGF